MGSACVSKTFLYVLNVLYAVLALALAAGSIWFFVQVNEFTSLRNSNHYLLDYNVYWPQAMPWVFFFVSVLALFATCCGFTGAKNNSRSVLFMYIIFMVIVIVVLVLAAVIALVFADSKSTEDFVKDTVWDVYFQSKNDDDVASAFGNIEKKLHCCGADSPRDYINWKREFPTSCCDVFYHGWQFSEYPIDCQFSNKLPNERYGCMNVASQYAKIAIKVLSAACIFIAFIGIICCLVAVMLSKTLKEKSRALVKQQHESESKKVLL